VDERQPLEEEDELAVDRQQLATAFIPMEDDRHLQRLLSPRRLVTREWETATFLHLPEILLQPPLPLLLQQNPFATLAQVVGLIAQVLACIPLLCITPTNNNRHTVVLVVDHLL